MSNFFRKVPGKLPPSNIRDKAFFVWYAIGVIFLTIIIIWILLQFKEIVAMLIISTLFSYFLLPIVIFLSNPINIPISDHLKIGKLKLKLPWKAFKIHTKKGLSRTTSISAAFLLMALVIAMFIFYIVPITTSEMQNFYSNRVVYKNKLTETYNHTVKYIETNTPTTLKPYLPSLSQELNQKIYISEIRNLVTQAIGSSIPVLKTFMGSLAHYIWIPFVTFYILMDYTIYKEALFAVLPKKKREEIKELVGEINTMLRQYIRGQMLVCLTIGVSITIAMLIMGIPYAVLIGILAGILDVIPYIGVIVTMIPAVILAFLMKGPLFALFVLLILYFIHWLEGHIIIPNIMGNSINMPPLVVIVALIMGAQIMGFIGMLLAVPVAATIRVVVQFYVKRRQLSEAAEAAETANS